MAATRIATAEKFIGTAAERAALTTTGLHPGATFGETDTGLEYILDGGGSWAINPFRTSKLRVIAGSAAAPSIAAALYPTTGLYWTATPGLGFTVGGTAQAIWTDGTLAFQKATDISTTAAALTLTPTTVLGLLKGFYETLTPNVSANSQTLNAAPSATTLTSVNGKTFTGTGGHIVLPAIVPVVSGGAITLTGLSLSQGAITSATADLVLTVTQLSITGANQGSAAGLHTWIGAAITTPNQAANGANNVTTGISITGGATAGGGGAYQRGINITMNAATDNAIYVGTGQAYFGGRLGINGTAVVSWASIIDDHTETNPGVTNPCSGVFRVTVANTSGAWANRANGITGVAYVGAANNKNWTDAIGVTGVNAQVFVNSGATGTITGMAAFVNSWLDGNNILGCTVTNYYGYYFRDPGVTAPGAITNLYGIYIAKPTSGATINRAIYAAGGICELQTGFVTPQSSTANPMAVLTTAASANLKNSDNTEKSTTALAYTKIKEIKLNEAMSGTVRVNFDLKTAGGGATATGRVYKNGVALGTEQTDVTGGYVTKTEDLGPFVAGDLIQIYAKTSDGAQAAYVQNFQLLYDVAIVTTALSVTNQDP